MGKESEPWAVRGTMTFTDGNGQEGFNHLLDTIPGLGSSLIEVAMQNEQHKLQDVIAILTDDSPRKSKKAKRRKIERKALKRLAREALRVREGDNGAWPRGTGQQVADWIREYRRTR